MAQVIVQVACPGSTGSSSLLRGGGDGRRGTGMPKRGTDPEPRVGALAGGVVPEVEGVARPAAAEAVEAVVLQVDAKQRASPAVAPCNGQGPRCWAPRLVARLEAEQVQDGGHRDGGGARRRSRWPGVPRAVPVLGGWPDAAACAFAGLGQLAVAGGEDFRVAAFELVLGGDVADGAVQADGVVMLDVIGDDPPGVVQGQGRQHADAIALEGLVPAFDFAVALGVIGRDV